MQIITGILRWLLGVVIAVALTLGLFLVLPIMQAIGEKEQDHFVTEEVNVIQQETPPDIEEPEPTEPEEPEEIPEPELTEEPLVADLSQLDIALTGTGVGIPGADTTINIDSVVGGNSDLQDNFQFSVDQEARVLYQESPKMTSTLRRKAPATVVVLFIVDKRGRVSNATVQSSSDPAFERAALEAVKRWRFEPAQSQGKPTESRMRIPITFPKE